jgi:hypothetical protein
LAKDKTDEEILREQFYGFVIKHEMSKALHVARDLDIHEVWSLYNELGTVRDSLINTLIANVIEEYMKVQEKAQRERRRRGKMGPLNDN